MKKLDALDSLDDWWTNFVKNPASTVRTFDAR